jgi:hypothetical protein
MERSLRLLKLLKSSIENKIEEVVEQIENEVMGRIKSPPWGI